MNIHILPTNKPSELYINTQTNLLCRSYDLLRPKSQNMYITNDEEIKEGDWCIYLGLSMTYFKVIEINDFKLYYGSREYFNRTTCKKIILTTDSKLIKDGLQDIDDDFLEWFLNNQTCCDVMTIPDVRGLRDVFQVSKKDLYKIIIPKDNLGYTTKSGIEVTDEMVRAVMIPKEYFGTEDTFCHYSGLPSPHAYEEEEPKQAFRIKAIYIKNLKMSEGKVAAQVAHAVKNLGISPTDCDIVVLGVSTTKFNTLTSMHDCYIQRDKGLTEVESGTATAAAWIDNK